MTINKYLFICAGIIFAVGVVAFSAIYIILKHYDDLKKNEYSILAKEREVHGIIKKKEIDGLFSKGALYIDLENKTKFSSFETTVNFLYEDFYLSHFLQIGDSISKEANSDTIYIYRDDCKFHFALGKLINEDKRN